MTENEIGDEEVQINERCEIVANVCWFFNEIHMLSSNDHSGFNVQLVPLMMPTPRNVVYSKVVKFFYYHVVSIRFVVLQPCYLEVQNCMFLCLIAAITMQTFVWDESLPTRILSPYEMTEIFGIPCLLFAAWTVSWRRWLGELV